MPDVLTLDKSLTLLETVFASSNGIGTRTLASRLRMNVATAHNIARTFCKRGYLRQDAASKLFFPGFRMMILGRHPSFLKILTITANNIVEELAASLNESVMLASMNHGQVMNLKYIPSKQALRVQESDDITWTAYCTAVGKVLLSSLSDNEIDDYVQKTPLKRFTTRTISTPLQLKRELKKVREKGYAQTWDEAAEGISAVAVPVRDPWGNIFAGIGTSAPTVRMRKPDYFHSMLKQIKKAATAIELEWKETSQMVAPAMKGFDETSYS